MTQPVVFDNSLLAGSHKWGCGHTRLSDPFRLHKEELPLS